MKYIESYGEDYSVSKKGEVYSHRAGKFLKPMRHNYGYRYVSLCKDGKRSNFLIHRLVAIAFIPNPENKRTVNHKNGDKTDNSLNNLEWNTYSENHIHAHKNGLNCNKGENCGMSKLDDASVREIKNLLLQGVSNKEIASMYNVKPNTISTLKKGHTWTHIN
jgi:exopolyphosphatase/pppGpp-phosphohydrolase